jgi:hypothetical protein
MQKHLEQERLARARVLETFFKEVAELTVNHDVLNDHAVVYPRETLIKFSISTGSIDKVEPA